jgi:hypothetical protein
MKIQLLFATLLFAACTPFAATTHMAKITVRVVDESGKPMTNVPVAAGYVDSFRSSADTWGFPEPYYKDIIVPTDKHGLAVITVYRAEQELYYSVSDYPGYYRENGSFTFKSARIGPWQPWNPTVQLVLEAIGVQVTGYAKRIINMAIPAQGKPLGYDLMAGDWVPPYGKGETPDFVFQFDTKITNYLTLTFSNEGDGIQFVASSGRGLQLPRLAPADAYESMLMKWDWMEHGTNNGRPFVKGYSNYHDNANYFFRVRTNKDTNGKIVSALYGYIRGDVSRNLEQGKIDLNYCLNPEPNSRNMEFAPNRNLLGKPSPFKQSP